MPLLASFRFANQLWLSSYTNNKFQHRRHCFISARLCSVDDEYVKGNLYGKREQTQRPDLPL